MALKKVKELPSGVSGEYWKVIQVSADRLGLKLSAKIALFKDKAASDAGKQHLGLILSTEKQYTKEQLAGDLTALAYLMFKDKAANPNLVLNSDNMIRVNLQGSEDA